ncbi:hypothetical protein RFI_24985 [Reticulomyxa filosa]|uniref:TRAF-type domain-containing protein n=1 Tax=Reticulomyxa filosa TaxID=46433 RepID=X6MFI7_RETFI|nr:hypothetical protein RFI_24985 [Reticulomyxa filosa]|eukprot:ETO12391.1 hypothetical protein RFI_24985 [Reticulomyxa filosa]
MLTLNVERDERKLEKEKENFSSSGCYNKDWVLLTNNQQKLNHLICCICKQCNEHKNAGQVYLVGEECLQVYLKQNLLVICHRQYDLKKDQSKEEHENECNYKGKICEMKDHLDNSCRLISIRQIVSLIKELQSQLQNEKLQTEELRKMNLKSNAEIEKLKESAFDIRIIKLEEILKSNNDQQCKQIVKLNVSIFYFFKKYICVFVLLLELKI